MMYDFGRRVCQSSYGGNKSKTLQNFIYTGLPINIFTQMHQNPFINFHIPLLPVNKPTKYHLPGRGNESGVLRTKSIL